MNGTLIGNTLRGLFYTLRPGNLFYILLTAALIVVAGTLYLGDLTAHFLARAETDTFTWIPPTPRVWGILAVTFLLFVAKTLDNAARIYAGHKNASFLPLSEATAGDLFHYLIGLFFFAILLGAAPFICYNLGIGKNIAPYLNGACALIAYLLLPALPLSYLNERNASTMLDFPSLAAAIGSIGIVRYLILLILIIALIYYWQPLRLAAQRLQNGWQRDLAATLGELRQHGDSAATWLTLCGLGFLYGILHAVGPGHGKAIIATFTLSQPAARRQTLAIATGGALLQGVSAIIWVALAMGLLQHLIADTVSHTLWLNRANALLIAAIGAYIIYRHRPHRHHAHCACHAHGARPLTPWAAAIAIGIRPCSGAVLSLAVAWSWGIAAAGIAMTLAIACGTALTITAIALLCYHGKQHLARRLLRDETRFARLTQTLALAGGLALVILAALLWQADGSALPSPTNPVGLPR